MKPGLNDPMRRMRADPEGPAYFRAVRHADGIQTVGLWLSTLAVLALRLAGPDAASIQLVLLVLAGWMVAVEAYLFMCNDTFILRGKTAYLLGFFTYILLSPTLGSIYTYPAAPRAVATAVGACLLFLSSVMTMYCAVDGTRPMHRSVLEGFVVSIDPRRLMNLLLLCFVPAILLRILLQDWSTVTSVLAGLFGIGSQPWRHTGFGNSLVVFAPIHWLYALVPGISGLGWALGARYKPLRPLVVMVWLFVFPALMLQRSRGLLISSLVLVLASILLVSNDRRVRRNLYLVFILLLPLVTMLANLLLVDRGSGRVATQMVEGSLDEYQLEADPRTLMEDNLYYFTGTAGVVPDVVPHRSALELYYYMAINPIPRVLWPDKPWMSQKYLGKIRPYYAAITIVGDFYVYGGWWHVLIGGLVFGWVLKRIDIFGKSKANPETGRVLLYASLILALFFSIRALWSLVVSIYSILTLMILLWMIRHQVNRAGNAGCQNASIFGAILQKDSNSKSEE